MHVQEVDLWLGGGDGGFLPQRPVALASPTPLRGGSVPENSPFEAGGLREFIYKNLQITLDIPLETGRMHSIDSLS